MEALERLGLTQNTIVVFTSDNGAVLRFPDDGHPDHNPNGPWRGQKADAWEGGHREPLIVRWPARFAGGRTVDTAVCLTDLLPTIAAAAGADLPEVGRRRQQPAAAVVGPGRGLRIGSGDRAPHERRIVRAPARQAQGDLLNRLGSGGFSQPRGHPVWPPSREGQLYDLVEDPEETRNLWNEEPQLARRLSKCCRRSRVLTWKDFSSVKSPSARKAAGRLALADRQWINLEVDESMRTSSRLGCKGRECAPHAREGTTRPAHTPAGRGWLRWGWSPSRACSSHMARLSSSRIPRYTGSS